VCLLGLDESIIIDVEVLPNLVEVGLDVAWHLGLLQFVRSLKNNTGSLWTVLLLEDSNSVANSVVVLALGRILREHLVHNLVLVGTVEILNSHV